MKRELGACWTLEKFTAKTPKSACFCPNFRKYVQFLPQIRTTNSLNMKVFLLRFPKSDRLLGKIYI